MVRRAWAIIAALAICAAARPRRRRAAAARPDDLALALRFRPRLLFDAKERWRPTDVDRFLAEPGHQACPPVGQGPCAPFTSVAQLTPAVAYLDMHGTHGDGSDAVPPDLATCAKTLPDLRECDGDGRSVDLRARRAQRRPHRDRLLVVPALQRLLARPPRVRLGGRDA